MRQEKGRVGSGSASSVFAAVCAVVMVLLWAGPAPAETWSIQTVDTVGVVGAGMSLALDKAGNPRISYIVNVWTPKYAAWDGSSWSFDKPDPYPYGLGAILTSLVSCPRNTLNKSSEILKYQIGRGEPQTGFARVGVVEN